MNGVSYVVALVESPDPPVKPVKMDGYLHTVTVITHDHVSSAAAESQQSETPYRLFIALDINFGPLAPCDLGLKSMKSGDFTC
jgi:hypothetical protein